MSTIEWFKAGVRVWKRRISSVDRYTGAPQADNLSPLLTKLKELKQRVEGEYLIKKIVYIVNKEFSQFNEA